MPAMQLQEPTKEFLVNPSCKDQGKVVKVHERGDVPLDVLVEHPDVRLRVCHGRYQLDCRLGSGAFGEVFQGTCGTTGLMVAIKLEKRKRAHQTTLKHESDIYEVLRGQRGVPKIRWWGHEGDYNMMVIDMMGPNLQELFEFQNQRFSYKTIFQLAIQLITRMETVHSKGVLHRDIKCENFVIGSTANQQSENDVYVIDFGLSTFYVNRKTGQHVPYAAHDGTWGTMRYTSIRSHNGQRQARRDDLESIGFMLSYFMLEGQCPWSGIPIDDYRAKSEAVRNVKKDFLVKGDPSGRVVKEWFQFMDYCHNLKYEETPDYEKCRNFFKKAMARLNLTEDGEFDWSKAAYERKRPSSEALGLTFEDYQARVVHTDLEQHARVVKRRKSIADGKTRRRSRTPAGRRATANRDFTKNGAAMLQKRINRDVNAIYNDWLHTQVAMERERARPF